MARQLRPISFESYGAMAGHLDRWAASSLTSPEAWQQALIDSHEWLDFAPRNQALLISYGINGPAAGAETWRLVPSSEPGRECAVRAGENGFPVRVPITTVGREPDPFVGGTRPTRSQVERWEWRPVFSVDQLARRPAVGALTPHIVPDVFVGESGASEFAAAVTRVSTATVRGRVQRSTDPHRMLADAAGRLPRSSDRPELIPTLREQVAWLVAERVGHAPTDQPPPFDPTLIRPRERWERLLDVLDPARRLTASLGATIGVDLVRSSIPRMQVIDDRVVPAGRRHRLPAATLEGLPIGRWVSVGPYTADEWLARGEIGTGSGAFLRLNKTAYVVAVESGDTVTWRLEDIAARTGHGRLANGVSRNLDTARRDVASALAGRYPALAVARSADSFDRALPTRSTIGGPMQLDHTIAQLADSDTYDRQALVRALGTRLDEPDRSLLTQADHTELVRLLGAAGITAATTVAVLHADGCQADAVAGLLPVIGVPIADGIRVLHQRWDVDRVDAARMLAATGSEMRQAGCDATEILSLRPESILTRLPAEPHLWELVAGTMTSAGHSPPTVVAHLVQYAPTAECFATGLATFDDPSEAIGLAARHRAQPTCIAAAADRFGLAASDVAEILRAERTPITQAVAVLGELCDFDDTAVATAWQGASLEPAPLTTAPSATRRITSIGGTEIGTAEELLATLNRPTAADPMPSLFELLASPVDLADIAIGTSKT